MDKFLSVFRAYSPERPLRPLLLATGAAAAAAGIYCLVKWTDGNKMTANPEDTSDPGVCNGATEPALVRLTEVVQDQMKECEQEQEAHRLMKSEYQEMMETLTDNEKLLKVLLAEAEEKHQKAVETITQLEQEKSNQTDQVKSLQDTVKDMWNQLCDTQLQCDELKKECKREQEAHNLLKVQYREMMETNSETVLKDSMAEAEEKHQKAVETITQLEQEKSNQTDQVKSLQDTVKDMWNQLCDTQLQCDELKKDSMAEAEEKHQKAVETITQLEQEKSNLTDQVKSLQDTMKDMWNQLCDTQLQCDKIKKECEQEQEAHRLMKSEYQEMMETLTDNEKLLKVLLAEAEEKHQKAVETITQLEQEKSNLTYQVKTLQNTMQDMGNQLCDTQLQCDELKKDSMAEAEEKHQKAVETITQLEQEKTNLTDQVKSLQDTMKDMWNQLCDTQLQCDELKKECKREQEAHNLLKVQYREMMETNSETVLKDSMAEAEEKHQKAVETITQLEQEKSNLTDQECEQEQEAHRLMKSEYQEMMETLTDNEKLLKVLLAEAEEKHQKAVETITQLEQEKSNLTYQVKTLQNTMQDMGNQLCDTQLQCDELKKECEQEQETHRLLKVKFQEMMETLTDSELLKDSLAEAEEKHQKAVETITQLEQEKSILTDQVKSLRETTKDMWNHLSDTQLQCDKIKKASLAEAEEKHQKAVETITQLEQEKTNLTDQVKSLKDIVWDMWIHLSDTQLQCDELKNESEREQEAHNLLQLHYHEMMETLTNSETVLKEHVQQLKGHSTLKMEKDELKQSLTLSQHLLKESPNQAEEKHQNAVQSTDELEAEMSDLKTHMDPVRQTRGDKIKRMFLKICKSDKCLGTKDTESSLPNILRLSG
ncbi:hypothetical protein Q7C36_001523 [Tachysurus vachellii]|uniref:GAT domain-containing protein n=1 Tax=Tachysurus vachellii TaxID=175792 RepID=A0AA88P3H2_TACVA|nr:hypothetical protein Q7C36_001523 [Tachysurus vachellii]